MVQVEAPAAYDHGILNRCMSILKNQNIAHELAKQATPMNIVYQLERLCVDHLLLSMLTSKNYFRAFHLHMDEDDINCT